LQLTCTTWLARPGSDADNEIRRALATGDAAYGVTLMRDENEDTRASARKPRSGNRDDRQARKAAALRENLRKRKAQQRGRQEKPE